MDNLELSEELTELLYRQFKEERFPVDTTGAARCITGNHDIDSYLHHLEKEYGLKLNIGERYVIIDYEVLDEKKFMMFILRWS